VPEEAEIVAQTSLWTFGQFLEGVEHTAARSSSHICRRPQIGRYRRNVAVGKLCAALFAVQKGMVALQIHQPVVLAQDESPPKGGLFHDVGKKGWLRGEDLNL